MTRLASAGLAGSPVTSFAASALGAMASATHSPLAGGIAAVCFGVAASSCLGLIGPRGNAALHQGLLSGALPAAPRGFELTAALMWTGVASWAFFAESPVEVALPVAAWATLALVIVKSAILAARCGFAGDPAPYRASIGVATLALLASALLGAAAATSTSMSAAAGVGLAAALVGVSVLATPPPPPRRGGHANAPVGDLLVASAVVVGAGGIGAALNPEPAAVALSAAAGAFALVGGAIAAAGAGLVTHMSARPSTCTETLWEARHVAERKGGRDDETLENVLAHLGQLSLREKARPELWLLDENTLIRSDLAGYAQRCADAGPPPAEVLRLASAEPLGVLRREVAERYCHAPEVKSAADWLRDRQATCAAELGTSDEPLGLLLLPMGNSTTSLGVAELTALRDLCDRLSAPLLARSSLARSRAREQLAQAKLDDASARIDGLEQQICAGADQHRRFAELLARPLDAATYSPQFRLARERLDRLAQSRPAVAIIAPPGTDPKPWAARFHVSGPRAEQALICTDAATLAVELAADATTLPSAGTLAVFDVTALTLPLQARFAEWIAERRPQTGAGKGAGPGLAVSSFAPPAELRARGLLDARLAECLEDSYVIAPSLAERPEDLRALTLDVLCRVGLRTRGEPLGLAPDALHQLLDQVFGEGLAANESELETMIYRAAANAQIARPSDSKVLKREDLEAGGLKPEIAAEAAEATRHDAHPASGAHRDKLAPC